MISVAFLYLQGLIHFPDLVEPFILPLPRKLTINEYQRASASIRFLSFLEQLNVHFITEPSPESFRGRTVVTIVPMAAGGFSFVGSNGYFC